MSPRRKRFTFTTWIILAALLIASQIGLKIDPSGLLPIAHAQGGGNTVFLPVISNTTYTSVAGEWTQHAHDALRTSFNEDSIPTPWYWKWAWNGPNASGAVSSGKFSLPRNVQPVTGGGRVYVAASSRGVYALNADTGAQLWNRNPGGNINSTPAYDADTDTLFVVSSNGYLYRLNGSTGVTNGQYNGQATSDLPLPPAIYGNRVYFSMGSNVFAVNKSSMSADWSYAADSPVHTPPAVSPANGLVIAVSQDLYVHAIYDSNGSRAWRIKPTPLTGGEPGDSNPNAEAKYGWPVVAEVHNLVLIKYRLNWSTLWHWNPWPGSNAQMRSNLNSSPNQQALFALNLSNGSTAFVSNVGHGGYGDGGYMPMGPQPVVKRFDDGSEVAYVVMRGSDCLASPCDGRWDSRLGEMMLDSQTVSGFQAGYVRFMDNTFFPTDEQVNLSMAGDDIFGGHWMFGIAHKITNRASNRGASSSAPITTSDLPHIITSTSICGFSSSHYCSGELRQDGDPRAIPSGFYIYYNQGKVYDQYWRGYAAWVISNGTIYFASNDGAIVALSGSSSAQASSASEPSAADDAADVITNAAQPAPDGPIDYTQAAEYAGQTVTVEGEIQYTFNNGKAVLLGFANPHQGVFKGLILKDAWANFDAPPEQAYLVGQRVRITGLIEWYQGDPTIFVTDPGQIEILE